MDIAQGELVEKELTAEIDQAEYLLRERTANERLAAEQQAARLREAGEGAT